MPISVTPVLSSVGYVSDVRDQTMALLRFMIMNPGAISSLWPQDLISFTEVAASNEQNRSLLCSNLSDKIINILGNKFGDTQVNADVTTEIVSGTSQYRVIFSVSLTRSDTQENVPLIVSGRFLVDPETYDITIEWNQDKDTASLMR